ncbi:MAG: D-tyrosyl-tRNA(Tyr) deacylase [Candidatus Marinimicrobia bacterium]|nr:D-tyrosyl-tRNA(Tyr) deacylase [Candidatus Neomarinimicrobiota bacterium]
MVVVLQRVSSATVEVDDLIVGSISKGFLLLLGVYRDDTESDAKFLVDKIAGFRIFSDENRNMNLSIEDVKGSILVVSQFTLCGDWRKGKRPGFQMAAPPEEGNRLYQWFVKAMRDKGIPVETGEFGALMNVSLVNDGPVTFVLDSREK